MPTRPRRRSWQGASRARNGCCGTAARSGADKSVDRRQAGRAIVRQTRMEQGLAARSTMNLSLPYFEMRACGQIKTSLLATPWKGVLAGSQLNWLLRPCSCCAPSAFSIALASLSYCGPILGTNGRRCPGGRPTWSRKRARAPRTSHRGGAGLGAPRPSTHTRPRFAQAGAMSSWMHR